MAKSRVRKNGLTLIGTAKKINPIERDVDNTSDLARKELAIRSKKRKAASDQTVPGKVVTAPPTQVSNLGG